MNKLSLLLSAMTVGVLAATAGNNVAYQDDNVRFTVITDGTVRMEYAPDGRFVDDKSFVAVEREYPDVNYKVKDGKWVEIDTDRLTLRYKKNSGKFTPDNLIVKGKRSVFPFEWRPGMQQQNNLKGTYRTLDGVNGDLLYHNGTSEPLPIEDGIIARDGWTLIDDSQNFLFDGSEDWDWVKERNADPDAQDWYFLAYGKDYKKALADYALFAGKMPLPPRYAFGYWWSRYWAYSDQEYRNLIDRMDAYGIPIDVLVVDMDWHYTDGVRGDWTGFSWNESLFPDPNKFLNYLRDRNLKITLNLHPADGIKHFENAYPQVATDMGMNPAEKKDIPWYGSDKTFMTSVFNNILHPMEREGVSFWWLDWQQYPNDLLLKDLSNTWWINYAFFSRMDNHSDARPMLYHRWGGLGNHRYQIGFSGDTYISWESLDYQPYFNSTASNVLYGFWSHDIGGHMLDWNNSIPGGLSDRVDPEMYVRWMQFGAYSPILRTHSTKDLRIEKEPWAFEPEITEMIRDIVQQRYRMAPYVYTTARQAHDTAVSMCRPMYYDYPDNEEAYDFRNQYMFGDNMMIAPVTAPVNDGYATVKVWLPEGQWYEEATGTMLDGGRVVERKFALDEYPVYIKAGAVIPYTATRVKNLSGNDDPIEIAVYPGREGSFSLYEDAGDSKDYETRFARTQIDAQRSDDGMKLTVDIAPRNGSYEGMPMNRDFSVRVVCSDIPESVTVDGAPAEYTYDPKDLSVIVKLPQRDLAQATSVVINYAPDHRDLANGLIGRASRVVKTLATYKAKRNGGRVFDDDLGNLGSMTVAIGYHPERLHQLVDQFEEVYNRLPEVLSRFGNTPVDIDDAQWIMKSISY